MTPLLSIVKLILLLILLVALFMLWKKAASPRCRVLITVAGLLLITISVMNYLVYPVVLPRPNPLKDVLEVLFFLALIAAIFTAPKTESQALDSAPATNNDENNELKISNERFKLALKATNEAIWEWDILKNQILWNEGYERIFQRSGEVDSLPENWQINIYKPDREIVLKSLKECLHDPSVEVWRNDYRYMKGNEEIAWVEMRGFVLRDEIGKPFKMIGSMADITERKMFQETLMESIIQTQEEERNRIAKDLHDGIVQELVACGMKAELIRLTREEAKRNEGLAELLEQIKKTTNNTRNLSHGLLSADINQMNLAELIDRLAFQLNIISSVEFSVSNQILDPQRVSDEIKINLYRTLQELTTNIVKHSKATAANISIEQADDEMHVSVTDNGIGLTDSPVKQTGIGMYNIKKRMRIIGGTIEYSSPSNGGLRTDIHIHLS